MASISFQDRSNSLPTRTHPLASELDEQICRLRSQAASTSSSSIGHKLNSLQDLYDCVDKFLQLPTTQQSLIRNQNEALDGSLRLLDLCNTAKDVLSQMNESVAELQSAMRRRHDLEGESRRFLKSRKLVKKVIMTQSTLSNKSSSSSMLGEVESIVVEVLESLLWFVSQSSSSKSRSWSLVSKMMGRQKIDDDNEINEFAEVDSSLKMKMISCEEVQVGLKNLQPCIQDLEEGVESLFRRLIKTRSSILNINNV
ncbi:hypothetical protein LINGRAHAP2_LOCUS12633 [Linum grandiflorum]